MLFKIGVLKIASKFKGKHLCKSLFFNKKRSISYAYSRSRHPQMFFKIAVLKNFAKFKGKHN